MPIFGSLFGSLARWFKRSLIGSHSPRYRQGAAKRTTARHKTERVWPQTLRTNSRQLLCVPGGTRERTRFPPQEGDNSKQPMDERWELISYLLPVCVANLQQQQWNLLKQRSTRWPVPPLHEAGCPTHRQWVLREHVGTLHQVLNANDVQLLVYVRSCLCRSSDLVPGCVSCHHDMFFRRHCYSVCLHVFAPSVSRCPSVDNSWACISKSTHSPKLVRNS